MNSKLVFLGVWNYTNFAVTLNLFDNDKKKVVTVNYPFTNSSYVVSNKNGVVKQIYDWDKKREESVAKVSDKYVINNKVNFLCNKEISFGDLITFRDGNIVKGNRVDNIIVSVIMKKKSGTHLVYSANYDWENFEMRYNCETRDIASIIQSSHITLSWNNGSLGKVFKLRDLLVNFADYGKKNDVYSESTNEFFVMDYSQSETKRFDLIKKKALEYLPIVFKISRMTYYSVNDLFNSYSKTAAFDYLKYSKLLRTGGALLKWEVDDFDDMMKYDKYYYKTIKGAFVCNIPIYAYDFESFFGSIYLELFSKDKNLTYSQWLHMETLKWALSQKRSSKGPKRVATKLLTNAGGFGGIKNYYGLFPPSKRIVELIVSTSKKIMERLIEKCNSSINGFRLLQANADSIVFVIVKDTEDEEFDDNHIILKDPLSEIRKFVETEHIRLRNESNNWRYAYFNHGMEYVLQRNCEYVNGDIAKGKLFVSSTIPLTIRKFNLKILNYLFENNGNISRRDMSMLYKSHKEKTVFRICMFM